MLMFFGHRMRVMFFSLAYHSHFLSSQRKSTNAASGNSSEQSKAYRMLMLVSAAIMPFS
jgi:hypothetical protein